MADRIERDAQRFIPTTRTVRDAYVYANGESPGDPNHDPDDSIAEFDRWLADHDARVLEAAAEAAEADADSDDHNATTMRVYRAWSLWLAERAARIRRAGASETPTSRAVRITDADLNKLVSALISRYEERQPNKVAREWFDAKLGSDR